MSKKAFKSETTLLSMNRETKHHLFLAKHVVPLRTYRLLKKLRSSTELSAACVYATVSALEQHFYSLEKKVEGKNDSDGSIFSAKTKLLLVPSKLHYLRVCFSERELHKVISLLAEIERDVTHVR